MPAFPISIRLSPVLAGWWAAWLMVRLQATGLLVPPCPLVARPGARCPTAARISISIAVQFGAQTSAAWRGRVRGAASCRAVAGFLERALNLVPHSPPSGRCSHQLPSPALCCTVLYCTVLYCTVLYCSHQLTSPAVLILNL